MGLKSDIYDAAVESMGGEQDLTEKQIKNLDKFSERMRDGIVDFIVNNTWTVSKFKASVEIEEFKTTAPFNGKVSTTSTVNPGQPVQVGPSGTGASTAPGTAVGQGTVIDPINMRKDGQGIHGGQLHATGHAWVGIEDPIPQSDTKEPENEFTEVHLFRDKIKKDTL
tara:strand:+ start:310 stop:810 length:501 start_codon:yes stop_codon:yes gene_type:complete